VKSALDGAPSQVNGALDAMSRDPENPGLSDVGVRNLIYALCLSLRPRRVLEIGGHIGVGCVSLGAALQTNGYGKVLTLEPQAHYRALIEKYVALAGVSDHVRIVPMFSHQRECWALLKEEGPFELIFIDGSHDYRDVLADLDLSDKLLHDNGVIVLHDVGTIAEEQDKTGKGGARQALLDFAARRTDYGVVFFEHPLWLNPCGAAIISRQRLAPRALAKPVEKAKRSSFLASIFAR
jgi:predicted O-methyltransferase YrrM